MADGARATGTGPRCDLDAEAACLSSALLDVGAALELIELLQPEDFWADANRTVFQVILGILRSGGTPDIVTVAAALRTSGKLDRIGGSPYLAQLSDATPAVANLREHAKIVRDLARVRRALDTFRIMAAEAALVELHDVDSWLERCELKAYAATAESGSAEETASTYRDLAAATLKLIEEAHEKNKDSDAPAVFGMPTGFRCLDEHLGGLLPGQLVVLAARPRCGKSSMMAQIAERIAGEQKAVLVYSLEMSRAQLMLRSQARLTWTPSRLLREGSLEKDGWGKLTEATRLLAGLPIVVDGDGYLTPMRLRAKVRRHYALLRSEFKNLELGAVVIDYLQLMNADEGEARRSDNRAVEIGRITRALKEMAKALHVPILALSQLNRPDKKAKVLPPNLEDLRDSGCIEQDADIVMFIHREDVYRPRHEWTNEADLIVAKARDEQEAVHKLKWNGSKTEFLDLSDVPPEDYDPRNDDGRWGQ